MMGMNFGGLLTLLILGFIAAIAMHPLFATERWEASTVLWRNG
jgi:hypothetical protein